MLKNAKLHDLHGPEGVVHSCTMVALTLFLYSPLKSTDVGRISKVGALFPAKLCLETSMGMVEGPSEAKWHSCPVNQRDLAESLQSACCTS